MPLWLHPPVHPLLRRASLIADPHHPRLGNSRLVTMKPTQRSSGSVEVQEKVLAGPLDHVSC